MVWFNKHKSIFVLMLLCAISIIMSWLTIDPTNTEGTYNNSLKHWSAVVFTPFYSCCSIISVSINKVAYIGSMFSSIFQAPVDKAQLQILQDKIENLERQLSAERAKNRRLEELYQLRSKIMQKNPAMNLVSANVTAVDPTEWFRYVTIDRGYNHGIRIDMAVITGSYVNTDIRYLTGTVVGKISDVYPNASRVQLITDSMSTVAVTIESLGDLVLMRGKPDKERCGIDEIPSTAYDALTVGDVVTVDERSNIFPPGMLVGNIYGIKKEIEFCPVEVEPAFNFRKLKEVMVVDVGQSVY